VFPSAVEPYVADEIRELRLRGIRVIACSTQKAESGSGEVLSLQPLRAAILMRAGWLLVRNFRKVRPFLRRALVRRRGSERRIRAMIHTLLGAYYAALLGGGDVQHIHAHHGYFGSWVAMVAARALGIPFSMTLHGSDLLLHGAYLDLKLSECAFCVTISEFNRKYILDNYPEARSDKIFVRPVGIDCDFGTHPMSRKCGETWGTRPLNILSVGRLHKVKDHAFLVRACQRLKLRGVRLACSIVGAGPERAALQALIGDLGLIGGVRLLGALSREQVSQQYERADLVVLTSRSEGIPLVLMEAMAHRKIVLAPAITGIPELVEHGRTGFLYRPGCTEEFVSLVEAISKERLDAVAIGRAAREHVVKNFNRERNLAAFCDLLLSQLQLNAAAIKNPESERMRAFDENPVLQ